MKKQLHFFYLDTKIKQFIRRNGAISGKPCKTDFGTHYQFKYYVKDIYICKLMGSECVEEKEAINGFIEGLEYEINEYKVKPHLILAKILELTGKDININDYVNENIYRGGK